LTAPAVGRRERVVSDVDTVDEIANVRQARLSSPSSGRIAVLVPCHNEELTVAQVIGDHLKAIPGCRVFVYDNNSSDRTAAVARAAGATVRREPYQGKGNVVRRMFADVDADIYIMVDGDDTYDPSIAPEAIRHLLAENLDLVNIARISEEGVADRLGHKFGNRTLTGLVRLFFGPQFTDVLSGYKLFSRRFVKSFPAFSRGFEIETELVIHALELRMPVLELSAHYRPRIDGSISKLNTITDGLRILMLITRLLRDERPILFFGATGLSSILVSIILGIPILLTYVATGLVPRLPTAVLAVGLSLSGIQAIAVGLVLDTVRTGRREARRLAYLQVPGAGPR
jgi:glycosyltransferase involved in cell wall biosynthesis